MSGNKVCVCYRLCIRHTTERAFALYLISEIARCYFHILRKMFYTYPITRLVMSLGAIKCYANGRLTGASGHELREQNTKTTCDICLCLRKFLCSEVNIRKSGNTIPKSIYFCILFLRSWEWSLKSRFSWVRGILFVLF